jgi:imidazole glycerol-phosphate synthase subunit HisF
MRIIAKLDIKGSNVVKTVRNEGLKVVGEPIALARKYYKDGIDEIVYMDIVASLYGRNLDFDLLKAVSKDIFVPLTVGGGIRSLHDIESALRAGADKVAINTYAVQHPEFISQAAERFGAQCIVLAIDAKKTDSGRYEVYTDGGREKTGVDVLEWVQKATTLGIGEIVLSSVDRDGTRSGYDVDLVRRVSEVASTPVVAHAGAGTLADISEVSHMGVSAVSLSSLLHYEDVSVKEIKEYLAKEGIKVRV